MLLVALSLPVVALSNRQAETRRMEVQRQETLAADHRAAAALAERNAADARTAAARAETERLIAQRRATEAAAASKRQADQALADRQRQARQDAQANEEAAQARQDATQRAAEQQAKQQRETQAAADTEAVRRVAEGPYTSSDVEGMCKQAVAENMGVARYEVHQQGSFLQQMDARPKNMAFGQGRLWFWRPILKVTGKDTPFEMLCRVHDDGQVEVTDP